MRVEITISSDVGTASQLQVDIDASQPQQLDKGSVPLPFGEQFEVPANVPFPLRGVTVEAKAAAGATWIECRVLLDGEVISVNRAEGSGATATCQKKLRLGPQ